MVVVTRPAGENEAWLSALREAGFPTLALPLIQIAPVSVSAGATGPQALQDLSALSTLMFVSVNAVRYFFANLASQQREAWQRAWHQGSGPRCWATGGGTCRALLAEGVPTTAIDWPGDNAPRYDSEQLWQVVAPQLTPMSMVLIVRGQAANPASGGMGDGRDWLGRQVIALGATVHYQSVYQRDIPEWDAAFENAWRLAVSDSHAIWLMSSSQALQHAQVLMGADYHRLWNRRLLCTHTRIAGSARQAGWQRVTVCRPVIAEMIDTLRNL